MSEIDKAFKMYRIQGAIPIAPIMHDASISSSEAPPKLLITGAGSLMNIHVSGPKKELLQGLFWHHMLQHGICLAQIGFIALTIEISPYDVDDY